MQKQKIRKKEIQNFFILFFNVKFLRILKNLIKLSFASLFESEFLRVNIII
jgi:hypothetical protein